MRNGCIDPRQSRHKSGPFLFDVSFYLEFAKIALFRRWAHKLVEGEWEGVSAPNMGSVTSVIPVSCQGGFFTEAHANLAP